MLEASAVEEPQAPDATSIEPRPDPKRRPVMNEDLLGRRFHCTVCTNPIPTEMANKKSQVCSEACHELMKRMRRKPKDDKACRFCRRPATLSQRQAFNRYRKWEAESPELAHPQTWAVLEASGMSLDQFRQVAKEAGQQDFSLEYAAAPLLWARKPSRPRSAHENLDRAMEVLRQHWAMELAKMTGQEVDA